MPSAEKRQRKKENTRAAREARQAALRRRKRNRTIRNFVIAAVIFVGGALIITAVTGGSSKKTSPTTTTPTSVAPTTTTTLPLPAGCVATVPPKGAPQKFANAPAMSIDPSKTYTATISTSCGDFKVALDAKNAPKGVNNFVFLARKKFYDGLSWHRVVKGFVIQGGDPKGDGTGDPGYKVVTETPTAGYKQGMLAYAKGGQEANGTAGSQFFVVTGTNTPSLQQKTNGTYQYGAFGHVISGLANVLKLESLGVSDGPPGHPIYIFKITISES
ncbi:MAG TPA: peptidylprolyl isomerase [Acidimicrobiia bacterium]|nr:peptidylprolyl isomerase [Acidimicrobiia bacterium]